MRLYATFADIGLNGVRRRGTGAAATPSDRRWRHHFRHWALALAVGLALAITPAIAGDAPLSAFFGTYKGSAIAEDLGDGQHRRDMMVSIVPHDNGFTVTWDTTKIYDDSQTKPKHYAIDFEATKRQNIYGSQMRRNMFGDRVPLDPLSGDPFFWARIVDKTLTVYALHILQNGSFEMQIYHRTLIDGGLETEFIRFSETTPMRVVRGRLARVSE